MVLIFLEAKKIENTADKYDAQAIYLKDFFEDNRVNR